MDEYMSGSKEAVSTKIQFHLGAKTSATNFDNYDAKMNNYVEGPPNPPHPEPKLSNASSKTSGKMRKTSSRRSSSLGDIELYEDDTTTNMPSLSAYLKSLAGIEELKEQTAAPSSGHGGAAKLGTILGVYLPSIQHILGVQMFLRLLWIVGIAGLTESFVMVFICCLCTFFTSISISAIATNGVIDSGGAYFMISRNLGPEFGGAIGILYYLANTVATSMYLVGGVEILLVYMAPGLPQFGDPHAHENESAMFNNFRLYATGFLIVVFVCCAFGVKFVQFFAPISLACVFLSILAVFVGAFSATTENSPRICMLGDTLIKTNEIKDANGTLICNKTQLFHHYCHYNESHATFVCNEYFENNEVKSVPGIPGFGSNVIARNAWPVYLHEGESSFGRNGNKESEVNQDLSTTFFVLLAIFFPSVTGIMTGANMSGDLKDPQKSIPIGTIAAQLTTSFVYLSLVIMYAGTIEGALLRDKYGEGLDKMMVVAKLCWPNDWVLLVGSFLSCIGAGLQCLVSAPRLLQSIAKDDLVPILSPFSQLTSRNEPFRALLVTTLIAEGAILIGGIDAIAPVVDFFFLMSYCFVNLACALQTLLKAPNWRPRFKFFHWSIAVIGAILNLFIMFSTHWYYALAVVLLTAILYKYIEFKGAKKEWGDGIRGLALSTAQYSLLRVEEEDSHPKNWRPQLLVLLKLKNNQNDMDNKKMLQIANQLKAGQGLTVVATLLEGDLNVAEDRQEASLAKEKLKYAMKESKVKGFTEVVLCQNVSENVGTLIQSVGMGGLRPNTVMVGWPYGWNRNVSFKTYRSNFLDAVHRATSADMCLLVPKGLVMYPEVNDQIMGDIDVWWIIHDGGLLILLPFLLKQHKVWRHCNLRIFAVAQHEDNIVKMKEDLEKWVYQLRIDAEVVIIELSHLAVAPYNYERTMLMEERAKLARNINLSNVELQQEPQLLADRNRSGAAEIILAPLRKKSSIQQFTGKLLMSLGGVGSSTEDFAPAQQHRKSSSNALRKQSAIIRVETLSTVPEDERSTDDQSYDNPTFSNDNELNHVLTSHVVDQPGSELKDEEVHVNIVDKKTEKREKKFVVEKVEHVNKSVRIDDKKMRKMHSAVTLNKAIKEKSIGSRLVVLNLPKPPETPERLYQYMDYLEALTDGLQRVLLVRGSGKEVITIYS